MLPSSQKMVEDERSRLAHELKNRDAEVASLHQIKAAVVVKVEVQALRISALEAEISTLRSREAELVVSQVGVIQAVVEKLLRSNRFSTLASTLVSLLLIR